MENFIQQCLTIFILSQLQFGMTYADDERESMNDICITGKRQSPINFIPNIIYNTCPPIAYINFFNRVPFNIKNNGYFVSISGAWYDNVPTIIGNNSLINGEYIFKSFNLHWSEDAKNGTEHRLSGKGGAVEGQAWYVNKKYGSILDAFEHPDGFLITTIVYEESPVDAYSLKPIIDKIPEVIEIGSEAVLNVELSMVDMLLLVGARYIYYEGSLTQPPCTENVKWIISVGAASIPPDALKLLRSVKLNGGTTNNIRPLQNPNNREQYLVGCRDDLPLGMKELDTNDFKG